MNEPRTALRVYALLIRLYPRAYRQAFGTQMRQTFKDAYRHAHHEPGELRFWLDVISDAVSTSVIEHIAAWDGGGAMKQTWLQQGITYGARYGLLWIVLNLTNTLLPDHTPISFLSQMLGALLFFIGMPLLYGRISVRCSQQSRTVRAGIYAAVITALISSVIMLSSLLVVMTLFWQSIQSTAAQNAGTIWDFQHRSATPFADYLWAKNVNEAMEMAVVSLFYAGSIGTIGGLLGVHLDEPTAPSSRELQEWSWSSARWGLMYGLGVGLSIGLVIGINIGAHSGLIVGLGSLVAGGVFFGLLGVLVGGFTQRVDLHLYTE